MTGETSLFRTVSGRQLPALLNLPRHSDVLFVLGHGSGSTMYAPLMAALSDALSSFRIASLRFEYPYSCHPDFVPFSDMLVDDEPVLIETVRSALDYGLRECPGLKTFVGGHSISGLATTCADAESPLPGDGIISLGYPRKGDSSRSEHLPRTVAPILFVQGTNDALGTRTEIEEMIRPIAGRAVSRWIHGASHGFSVQGRDPSQVALEIAGAVREFADGI